MAMREIDSPYYDSKEAAQYLRTTVPGVYSRVKRGQLKPMPGAGRLMFTREQLDASYANGKVRRKR